MTTINPLPAMSWAAVLAAQSVPKIPAAAVVPVKSVPKPVLLPEKIAKSPVDEPKPEFTSYDPTPVDNKCCTCGNETSDYGIIGHSNNKTYHRLYCAKCYNKIKRNETK